jgi:hypothetical protein
MRGIGCLLMVIVPLFSYILGDYLAKQGFGSQVLPANWYGYMNISSWLTQITGIGVVARWLGSIPNLPATLAIASVVIVVVGGIISIVYGYMYSLLTPSRYGAMDVPPPRVKTKKYKR